MCLCAGYYARLPRLVFGATSYDVAIYGSEDLQLYREMSRNAEKRYLKKKSPKGLFGKRQATF
jgi:guanine deaminase